MPLAHLYSDRKRGVPVGAPLFHLFSESCIATVQAVNDLSALGEHCMEGMNCAVFGFLVWWRFGPQWLLLDHSSSGNTNGLKLILAKSRFRTGLRCCLEVHLKMASHRTAIRIL